MLFYAKHLIRRLYNPKQKSQGFTLIELLVTAFISGIIISGLLYLTNELLTSDQRESTKTETQRDLNFALDFISAELKQSTYVYPNAYCLVNSGVAGCTINSDRIELPSNSGTPVLAFWKQEPLDGELVQKCTESNPDGQIPCIKGNAYSLVVYALKDQDAVDAGKAAIFRYSMKMTEETLNNDEYLTPIVQSFEHAGWPHEVGDDDAPNPIAKFSEPELLVDFVDDDSEQDLDLTCPDDSSYAVTPSTNGSDSFYACVNNNVFINSGSSAVAGVGNQDIIIRLRGNAKNRSSLMGDESFLPVLEKQVFVRGVLDRIL